MKTKITFIGFVLLLVTGSLSAQICFPRVSLSWGNDRNRVRSNNVSINYNRSRNYRTYSYGNLDRTRRARSYNNVRDNRYNTYDRQDGFITYSLDQREVYDSYRATIDLGYRRGNLTGKEIDKIEDKFEKIEREFKCAYEDGYISDKDRKRIFERIAEVDERIYKEWHDRDFR